MFLRTLFDQFLPLQVQSYIIDGLKYYWKRESSYTLTLVFEEKDGRSPNDMFNATVAYLCTIISPDTKRLRITKNVNETHVNIKFAEKQEIVDSFEGNSVTWKYITEQPKKRGDDLHEKRHIIMKFDHIHRDSVFTRYLPSIIEKRWYLLYGPPGTGKSSLIAAMADYLKFDVYDLQLMNIRSYSSLKDMMLQTSNRSILVIEDIDCSTNIPDRNGTTPSKSKSRSDAKAANYLNIHDDHWRFREIEELIQCNKTVEVAGELMKSDNAEVVLDGLVKFLEGIAPVAIIDRQLPFEYTIASRSTDVMVWNAVYDAHNELKSMVEKQAGVERFDLIQTFHACKQEEGKPVGPYVIKMKNYVELERLGYELPQDLSVSLILNGLTSDFAGFAATPQVMAIQGGRIQKANKKLLNAKGKGKGKGKGKDISYIPKPAKSCITKHGIKGARKLKQGDLYLYVGNGVHARVETIGSFDLVLPNGLVFKNEVENQLGKTIKAIRSDRGGEYISQEFKDYLKACGIDYALESAACILNMVPSKKVDKYAEFLEKNILSQEVSERARELEEIQDERSWLDAMNAEMQSMKDNQVWRLVDLPPDGKTVGSKWLFKKKTDMDGNVHTYKARLVAKRFTQTYGVDYEETFSPVADIRAIRILIAIATFYDYGIWQMDVKNAQPRLPLRNYMELSYL
ncbi:retrotransposon protein, putative, ty1-copia subclass [Tanacetum coccineum]